MDHVKTETAPRLHPPKREPAFVSNDDDAVMTLVEWFELNHISPRTGQRILAGPDGLIVTELSSRRCGITRRNNRIWQESRARARRA